MRLIFGILILIVFSSCQARDFKTEINLALKSKDIQKTEKLLDEYYQINGTDELLEKSYLKLAIVKKDLKDILEKYKATKYMSVKKDKEVLKGISDIIIAANKKIPAEKRIVFYRNTLKVFPYSEEIYNEYLSTLLKLNKGDEALKVYLQFDELFNKTNKYLKKIIFFNLRREYILNKKIKTLNLMAELNIGDAADFLRSEISGNPSVSGYLKSLPDDFDMDVIKNIMASSNFSLRKHAYFLFIRFGNKDDVISFMKKLYPHIENNGLKILVYRNYYKRFKQEIDKDLIKKMLKERSGEYFETALNLIKSLNLSRYSEDLKKILGTPDKFKCGSKSEVLKTLISLDRNYSLNFVKNIKNIDFAETAVFLKKQSTLISLGEKVDCKKCIDIMKNKENKEEIKANTLALLIRNGDDISFFDEYDNVLYYNVFMEYHDLLKNDFMEKIAFTALKKWKDARMMIFYLKRLGVNQVDSYFKQEKIKTIKDRYFMKMIYFSVVTQKTSDKNDKFERFIIKKRFAKKEYLNWFHFDSSQINILIKLYLLEHKSDMRIKFIEKIIETLNK